MEIKTEHLIAQAGHLLDQLQPENPEVEATIANIRTRLDALLHLCRVGHEQTAKFGLSMLSPEIDELIREVGLRPTDPGEPTF